MKTLAILVLLSACGSDDSATSACPDLQADVTADHGTCVLPPDTVTVMPDCPLMMPALCGGNGDPDLCPPGWSISCENVQGQQINCTYGFDACTPVSDGFSFDVVQTRNGKRGLIVNTDGMYPGTCQFVACK